MRVGFVGLGMMGLPMARAVAAAGFDLTVWARRPEQLTPFDQSQVAASLDALASTTDLLCICVRDDEGVKQLVDAARSQLRADAAVVVHATVHPETVRAIAQEGLRVLDAPVSGGPTAAERGVLAVFAGGDRDLYEACLPVLSSYGDPVRLVGDVGAGQTAKLLNNLLFALHLGAAHDVLTIAAQHGLDVDVVGEMFDRASAASFALTTLRGAPTAYDAARPLLAKDLALLQSVAPGLLTDTATALLNA